MLTFEVLKKRINQLFRCHTLVETYRRNLLKHSPFVEAHDDIIRSRWETCLREGKPFIDHINHVMNRTSDIREFTPMLELISGLMTSEYFYEAKEAIDQLLCVYETHYLPLPDMLMISPLDKIRFSTTQFV